MWRYHPLTHRFELFCEGGGNSWGLDFDRHGNLFYSTNFGGYAMLHGVQGGYYWKQFGKHGALHNPYAFGYFDHVPHKNLHGGHVTVGGIIYQGDLAAGANFAASTSRPTCWATPSTGTSCAERGSTFSAAHGGDLLLANDTWFAPSDVTVGPDGAIYVCDWHDQRTAHPDPDADWDRTQRPHLSHRARTARRKQPSNCLPKLPSEQLVAHAGRSQRVVRPPGTAACWPTAAIRR